MLPPSPTKGVSTDLPRTRSSAQRTAHASALAAITRTGMATDGASGLAALSMRGAVGLYPGGQGPRRTEQSLTRLTAARIGVRLSGRAPQAPAGSREGPSPLTEA